MRHTDEFMDLITVGFTLKLEPTEQDREELRVLNSVLEKAGLKITIVDEVPPILAIQCRVDEAERILTRGAGRKRKPVFDASVREVRDLMQVLGADETAERLGISRSTLFRRLKQDDDAVF